MPEPYTSVVSNLFDTGLHQVVYRTFGGSRRNLGLMPVTEADFADSVALEAMVTRTKALGSIGTVVGERGSADLLREVCRHGSNPFKLANFSTYAVSFFDLAVCVHGSIDGERAVWDQLIVPNLAGLGISVDPGIVPRNAPEGLGVQEASEGGPDDPAMKLVGELQDVLRKLGSYMTTGPVKAGKQLAARRLDETPVWKHEVAALLAGPFSASE